MAFLKLLGMFGFVVVLVAMVAAAEKDPCAEEGELRRNFECAAIRHTKSHNCCWSLRDGSHGPLPLECCGTGWNTHNCEQIVDEICETHAEDL